MGFCLKTKLIISFITIIIITGTIASIIGALLIGKWTVNQAQSRVRNDLNAAREVLAQRLESIKTIVYFTTLRTSVKEGLVNNDRKALERYLQPVRMKGNMDILTLIDKRGNVILRTHNLEVFGDNQFENRIVSKVLSCKEAIASPVIIPREQLIKDGKDLAESACIKFIHTPKARPRAEKEETSGMMLIAGAPIFDNNDELMGVLYGGDLLNRNYNLVDKTKTIIYQDEKYRDKDIGTVTIFQGDLRISTNVMTADGKRAVGTRVSEEVYRKVLEEGKQWIDRAFVVNSWDVTAYEPIKDVDGKKIGMLYVGMLEQKFADMKRRALITLFGVTIVGMFLALIIANFLSNTIVKPINYLLEVTKKISEGDFSTVVEVKSKDELGELQRNFNLMASSLQERDEKLKRQTQQQLMRSEKLAALGRMAAGVAHEINNPLTGILTYSHLLLKRFTEKGQIREDLEVIVNETTRCREIVKNLLDFSRESIPQKVPTDINRVVEETISIIENQVYFEKIAIEKALKENLPRIMIDAGQLKQVLINLSLNAAEAMPAGGTLVFETQISADNKNEIIKVIDTGCGIPEEDINKIFDPCFTTKDKSKGTGLGLAVSYGIIQRHNGKVSVETRIGSGTTFTIEFPIESRDTV